jgi:hypothetical protein
MLECQQLTKHLATRNFGSEHLTLWSRYRFDGQPARLSFVAERCGGTPLLEGMPMANISVDLYRSCKSSGWSGKTPDKKNEVFIASHGKGSLYPDYVGFTRKDGSVRAPDITTFTDDQGTIWVRGVDDKDGKGRAFISWKEGVSVSKARGGFGYKGWFYFLLPEGTAIPDSLDVKHTPSRNDDGHYSIRCRILMRRDAYEGALDNLARAAIAKAVEIKKQSLYHS